MWDDYRKWVQRRRELEEALAELDRQESFLLEELSRVEEQVAYYGSLARDMKRTLDPPKLSQLLRSLRKI
jgi:tetrahydromethanopterin S-methyltransferase subunit B